MLGYPESGFALIAQARALRQGRKAPFEDFYEGMYYFLKGDVDRAVPLLQVASVDNTYRWSVIKIFAVIDLDANRVADAAGLMEPFQQVEVTEFDQLTSWPRSSLRMAKRPRPGHCWTGFPTAGLTPMWKQRFEQLRAKLPE